MFHLCIVAQSHMSILYDVWLPSPQSIPMFYLVILSYTDNLKNTYLAVHTQYMYGTLFLSYVIINSCTLREKHLYKSYE